MRFKTSEYGGNKNLFDIEEENYLIKLNMVTNAMLF